MDWANKVGILYKEVHQIRNGSDVRMSKKYQTFLSYTLNVTQLRFLKYYDNLKK